MDGAGIVIDVVGVEEIVVGVETVATEALDRLNSSSEVNNLFTSVARLDTVMLPEPVVSSMPALVPNARCLRSAGSAGCGPMTPG